MAKTEETTAPAETDLLGDPIVEPAATGAEAFQSDVRETLTRMQAVLSAFHTRLEQVEVLLKQSAEGDIAPGFEMDPAARISALEAKSATLVGRLDLAETNVESIVAFLDAQMQAAKATAPSHPRTLDELPSPFVQS